MSGIINEHVGQILTLIGFVIGGVWGGIKLFSSQTSDKPTGPSATNELIVGMIRSIDQKLEIGVREQTRNDRDVMSRFDSVDARMDDMWRELATMKARLEVR